MSLDQATVAFVWVWLPGATEPVVAGRLDDDGPICSFTYGRSYLENPSAISLYEPELPLLHTRQYPEFVRLHGCISDAGPDAWGRRVIERRRGVAESDTDLRDITYLLESSSNRIGALDFQSSPTEYRARGGDPAPIEDVIRAAEAVDHDGPLAPDLALALLHGTSIGGAQPKATVQDRGRHEIVKFSSRTDVLPTVKLEFVAMTLARRAGLQVAPVAIDGVLGRDVLRVGRFDRRDDGTRRIMVSARTMLRLGEMGIGASYSALADLIRARFRDHEAATRELFARLTFNILVGNTDDHPRNHAAFWDGETLELTPAYDIVPQSRTGTAANQAMEIGPGGDRASRLASCLAAAESYLLSPGEAREIIDGQIAVVTDEFGSVCDEAGIDDEQRARYWGRQFLNPYALDGY